MSKERESDRGHWKSWWEFLFSCVGCMVGLGNIWRFPYVCFKNGGGAFLIPYFIFMFLCALPLVFIELSYSQYANLGPGKVWICCPLFKGIGYGMVCLTSVVSIYYNVILAWTLYYFGMSFYPSLPWSTCNNEWNTDLCYLRDPNTTLASSQSSFASFENASMKNISHRKTSAEEFWERNVLELSDGIHNPGVIRWQLLLCLFSAWLAVFLCLLKGIKTSGKVMYVAATLPYLFLIILFIRGLAFNLEGAWNGLQVYLVPRWTDLQNFSVWGDAAVQMFYSAGLGWGGIATLASYNNFNNNCYRDAIILPLVDVFTSLFAGCVVFVTLGFMAQEAGLSVENVVKSASLSSYTSQTLSKTNHNDRKQSTQSFARIFRQTIGIPIGTNCAPLLADLFLYSYEAEFIQTILSRKQKNLAEKFNFTYRYKDDVWSINDPEFINNIVKIYPTELKIKDTTESANSASYLDLHLSTNTEGPGIAFMVYPEAVSKLPLPQLWSVLFFAMLFTVGLDSQMVHVQTLTGALVDNFPRLFSSRGTLLTGAICLFGFILGIPCITQGGIYVLTLIDWYCASVSVMFLAFLEISVLAWVYGVDRLYKDITMMIGYTPNRMWKVMWRFITPLTIMFVWVFSIISHKPVEYGLYQYPDYAVAIGWLIALLSILTIPVGMIYTIVFSTQGALSDRIRFSLRPTNQWKAAIPRLPEEHDLVEKEVLY